MKFLPEKYLDKIPERKEEEKLFKTWLTEM